VAVDATFGVSDGKALRSTADKLEKPLTAVLITHPHPDHYGGLASFVGDLKIPIITVAGVDRIIRMDDEAKDKILRPMFGDEWPHARLFPNKIVRDGEQIAFADFRFRAIDVGPAESHHDALWVLEGDKEAPRIFVGDLVYNRMHCYLADGHHQAWLSSLERLERELGDGTVLYCGHGEPGPATAMLQWQAEYIRTFDQHLRSLPASDPSDATKTMTEKMKNYLPSDDLLFLMQVSVPPLWSIERNEN
jgi:glyoxylase-like metal-dependent hydrolase (beta-lactamase superfamily II)